MKTTGRTEILLSDDHKKEAHRKAGLPIDGQSLSKAIRYCIESAKPVKQSTKKS